MSKVREVFESCLDLDCSERQRYLAEISILDPRTAAEVAALLKAHDKGDEALCSDALRSDLRDRRDPRDPLDPLDMIIGAAVAGCEEAVAIQSLPDFASGKVLGDFVVSRKIGEGAFAKVYLATQLSLGRAVALKVSQIETPEAIVMARLSHKNVVQVHSVTFMPDIAAQAICMQYIAGLPLDGLLQMLGTNYGPAHDNSRAGRAVAAVDRAWCGQDVLDIVARGDVSSGRADFAALTAEEVVIHFLTSVASALAHAHEMKVLHLDVKPSNVLIDTSGNALLMDFNVSFRRDGSSSLLAGGTPEFMAPEHAAELEASAFGRNESSEGVDIDERADIYSLGKMGQRMFNLLPAATASKGVRDGLNQILTRAISPDPSSRYASAAHMTEALEALRRFGAVERAFAKSQNNFLFRAGLKYPRLSIVAVLIVPNAIASVIQIAYNHVHIVGKLSELQRSVFEAVVLPWNIVVFTWGYLMIRRYFGPFFEHARRGLGLGVPADDREKVRSTLLRTPFYAMGIVATGWIVACFVFLFALGYFSGPLDLDVSGHLVASFALALTIPLSFCLLGVCYLNLVGFYPHYLRDQELTGSQIIRETAVLRRAMKVLRLLAGAVPLLGALIVVMIGPGLEPASGYPYQMMVIAFILTGIAGTWLSVKVVDDFMVAMKELDHTYSTKDLLTGKSLEKA